jgi:hypothetical protein
MIQNAISGLGAITESVLASAPGHPPDISQARVIDETAHRPWPLPSEPWLMAQTWRDLLFAHWAVSPDALRPRLPDRLPLDTFADWAWIGITPFRLTGLRPRGLPPLPGSARFPELNVRTYTTVAGKPGIFFLSLDAANRLAVAAARRAYRLPYFRAAMHTRQEGETLHYVSDRRDAAGEPAGFEASYRPVGPAKAAAAGSLEYFLTERYCLYTTNPTGEVLRGEIQHPPWPLQPATATISRNTMTGPWGVELPREDPLLHYARLQNVLIWPLRPAE